VKGEKITGLGIRGKKSYDEENTWMRIEREKQRDKIEKEEESDENQTTSSLLF